MRTFATPAYRNDSELLDAPGKASPRDLETTLRDIRRANIFGLGTWVVKHHLARLLDGHPRGDPIRILDLATGSGDIPEELCRWGQRKGFDFRITATDISPEVLGIARRRIERAGVAHRVDFAVCDAASPPFPDRSFDVVTCSLAFHHLAWHQASAALRTMSRLARLGFIINDIYRSQGAWYMAWFLTRTTTANYLTRHDGPASVLRAYTPAELSRLATRCGVPVTVHTHPFWRAAVVGRIPAEESGVQHMEPEPLAEKIA